jgi:hypothetical protein
MQAIEGIGISRFPNTGISYNMAVMPNGQIMEGQPVGRRGAHTVNDFKRTTCSTTACPGKGSSLSGTTNLNYTARAVVLAQNVGDPVTTAQVHAIARIGAAWKRCGYVSRSAKWHGHRCVSAKSCPGDKAFNRLDEVATLTEKYYLNGLGTTATPPPSTSGENELIGLKKGDTGERVKALQVVLGYAGFPRAGGVQSSATYDTATAAAVKKMSLSINSNSTADGNTVTAYVYAHLLAAFSKRYAGKPGAPGPAPTAEQISTAVAAWIKANPSAVQPSDAEVKAFVEGWLAAHAEEIRGPAGATPTKVAILGQVVEVEPAG